MKKTLLFLLVLAAITTASFAQQGSVLVYGNAGFFSTKNASDSKSANYSFSPGLGYQFSKKWTAGLELGLNGSRREIGTTNNFNKSSGFAAGPFVRYTQDLFYSVSMFGQANFNYTTDKLEPFNSPSTTVNGFNVGIIPAVMIQVQNGFALNFGFGGIEYSSSKVDAPGAKASTSLSFTFGQQVNFGISKNFGGKKLY